MYQEENSFDVISENLGTPLYDFQSPLYNFQSPTKPLGEYFLFNVNEKENNLKDLGVNLNNQNTNEQTDANKLPNNENINIEIPNKYIIDPLNLDDRFGRINSEENNEVCKEFKTIELKEDEEYENIKIEGSKNQKQLFISNIKEKKNSNLGRKTDEDKINGKKGTHTKDDEDNIMRKIKSFFGKSLYKYISSTIEEELLKLDININKSLKKDFNLNLFKKSLKDIYSETNISEKYKLKKVSTNENLIKRIYEEKREIEAITILNLTYEEAFEIFRRNLKPNHEISDTLKRKVQKTHILNPQHFQDANVFIEKEIKTRIKKKEKHEDIEKYINDIKRLILGFANWFDNKIGRER